MSQLTEEHMAKVEEILEKSILRAVREYEEWGLSPVNVDSLYRVIEQRRILNGEG